ncbi:GNAT family N-acetyltransferase [Streptomyces sp. SP18CS02]|uniref:GNAT family N-acetyltransferase n=1 Tax=Streptomyces sp. SP18CS02 TaxID=3002531 RepID=UPI002E7A790E|nr:GNAT family N-acetyltransferase [Streptomyces sp. SP18CS02]MEE1752748.1 GNAT family N-acetyltransferase [Streptomyces sp. SP18CS02]
MRTRRHLPAPLVVEDVPELTGGPREAWDRCAESAQAPFFYRSWYLNAYRRHPTQPYRSVHHLMFHRPGGGVEAIAPAYLQGDPLGVLGGDGLCLVSGCWQAYHSTLAAVDRTPSALDAAAEALRRGLAGAARRSRAPRHGLVNVPADDPAVPALTRAFGPGTPIDSLHELDLRGVRDFESYLALLSYRTRGQVRRHLRRAAENGVDVVIRRPEGELLETAVGLMVGTAERAGGRGFLTPGRLSGFLRETADHTLLLVARGQDTVYGVGAVVRDGSALHTTTAGFRTGDLPFSVHTLLLTAAVREAIATGCDRLVGGRRNTEVKVRFGLREQRLLAFIGRTGP